MVKRHDKINHAAHIKRRTEGTSNELSFSVLDAAKNAQLNGGEDDLPLVGEVSLFTLAGKKSRRSGFYRGHAIMSAFPQKGRKRKIDVQEKKQLQAIKPETATKRNNTFEQEIARRKKQRRIRNLTAMLLIVVTSVLLIVTGTGYFYHAHKTEQTYIQTLNDAIDLLTETDNAMLELDEELQDPFDSVSKNKLTSLTTTTQEADYTLKEADDLAKSASVNLANTNEQNIASQTVSAVSARISMIEYGLEILNEAYRAKSSAQQMMDGWYAVAEADEQVRSAAALVEDPTTENVEASIEQTNNAITSLTEASQLISQAQQNYPAVNRDPYIAYINKRIEALKYAIASDQALLDRNKEEAQAQNDAYNQVDQEAVLLAQDLDEDPMAGYEKAFDQATQQTYQAFEAARTQASASDAEIRDYLGKQTK